MSQNNKKNFRQIEVGKSHFNFGGKFELLTLREVGRHKLPDLQWRPVGKGLWQHGEFRPYPWKQNWVSFHSCHQRLLMQPDSEKIKTNPLITLLTHLDLTRKKRTQPNFGGNGKILKNQNKSVTNC